MVGLQRLEDLATQVRDEARSHLAGEPQAGAGERAHDASMEATTKLQKAGRAFLLRLVAEHGPRGAARILRALADESRQSASRKGGTVCSNGQQSDLIAVCCAKCARRDVQAVGSNPVLVGPT